MEATEFFRTQKKKNIYSFHIREFLPLLNIVFFARDAFLHIREAARGYSISMTSTEMHGCEPLKNGRVIILMLV